MCDDKQTTMQRLLSLPLRAVEREMPTSFAQLKSMEHDALRATLITTLSSTTGPDRLCDL